jgi:hypothetical protein
MPLTFEIATDTNSRFLRPTRNSGNVDIVNDFAWTLSPKSARKDVPYAYLTEYQQTTGQLIASLVYYARVAQNVSSQGLSTVYNPTADPTEPFKYKYIAEPTGFTYKFPYFSQQKHNRNTSFSGQNSENPFTNTINLGKDMLAYSPIKQRQGLLGKAAEYIAGMSTIFSTAQGVANSYLPGSLNFEFPQTWTGTDESSIAIKFHLFNSGTTDDIINNRNLAHILTYQNSANRRNFAIVDPTVIYTLYIPDVVNFPACFMESLDIKNIGNTRMMRFDGVRRIIPEAYEFNMSFKSLFIPTRNVMEQLNKGKTVEAITNIEGVGLLNEANAIQSELNKLVDQYGLEVGDDPTYQNKAEQLSGTYDRFFELNPGLNPQRNAIEGTSNLVSGFRS